MSQSGQSRVKRGLVFSPASDTGVNKRGRTGESDLLQTMEYNLADDREDYFDLENMKETILTRVNQALCLNPPGEGGDSVPSDSDSAHLTLLARIVPAIVTSVALAVGEVMKKEIRRIPVPSQPAEAAIRDLRRQIWVAKSHF